MALSCDDRVVRQILARYPGLGGGPVIALGNAGGFSGSRLWRVRRPDGDYCLRAWPTQVASSERLAQIHQLMRRARQAGLAFVPSVVVSASGSTWVPEGGRLLEIMTWQPGRADFHQRPTSERLETACTALAHLHQVWVEPQPEWAPCPAVARRLVRCREWQQLVQSGWHPAFDGTEEPLRYWAQRAWDTLLGQIDDIPHVLAPWRHRPFALQPCLCDVWHDHLLFEGDVLTGLVDYGGVKWDHVAVDLARLLGSLVEDDARLRSLGLAAYRRVRPLEAVEEALLDVLDRTGTLLALATWLRWLYREARPIENPAVVAGRLAKLVQRVEAWTAKPTKSLWTAAV